MRSDSKYRPKFKKQLLSGLRTDGKSIEEVCALWGISVATYHNWRKTVKGFEDAHAQGDLDKTSWWRKLQRQVASGESPGNAAVINLALKNEVGYVDKQEVEHTHNEQITTIRIERLPSNEGRILEHDSTKYISDGQPS